MSSWGMYKAGQGYWVRVLTAAAIAIITFATAGWIMGQMNVLSTKLPIHNWTAEIGASSGGTVTGTPKVGDRVSLVKVSSSGASPTETIGAATITGYDPSSSVVKIGRFEAESLTLRPEDATAFAKAGESGFSAQVKNGVRGQPMVQSIYLQGIAAAVVLIGGALIAYLFAGAKHKSVDFLVQTDMEMKKVAWSTRRDIWNSTLVVVGASFLLAAVLFGIDVVFQAFFKAIKVLQ